MEITINTGFREIFESEEFRDCQQFMITNSPEYTEKLKGYTPATMQADYPNREARSVVMGLNRFREIMRSHGRIACTAGRKTVCPHPAWRL